VNPPIYAPVARSAITAKASSQFYRPMLKVVGVVVEEFLSPFNAAGNTGYLIVSALFETVPLE